MDKLSIIGSFFALFALIGGAIMKGAGLAALWSPAAFTIVIIGTFAAIFLHAPPATMKKAVKMIGWVFKPPVEDNTGLVARFVEWSNIARKQGLLGLEPQVEAEADPFVKKGLQMLVDGTEPETLRSLLEIELGTKEHDANDGAKVFESMGIYAPTLGIIGAVLGLMAVMKNLADPSKLGHGIAAAFTATIYGIGAANLMFLPIAAKLKAVVKRQSRSREMAIEGLVAIAKGENPRNIESRLNGYLH
jgi:chemotaxis protein MotA